MNLRWTEACNPIKEIKLCIQQTVKQKTSCILQQLLDQHTTNQNIVNVLKLDGTEQPYLQQIHFADIVDKELHKFNLLYTITCAAVHTQ